LSSSEFFESVSHAFQIDPDVAHSKSKFLRALEHNLVQQQEKGILSVLVSDEAQSLPDDLLEEVRLLANLETETEKLLRVVLAGQPALGDRLNEPRFRHLKQRIGLRCVLPALDLQETAIYIAYRISLAGGDPARVFSRGAVMAIYEQSRGIPRTINVICENALLTGFAADERPIGPAIVMEVCRDFDLLSLPNIPADAPPRVAERQPPTVKTADFRRASAANDGAVKPASGRSLPFRAFLSKVR
jgi:general secretion pathway protein A